MIHIHQIIKLAHRLSTIRNADEVVLMSQGRVEDKGSFQKLIQDSGDFKKMVELQEV